MNELEVVNSVYALGKMGATLCVDSQPNPVLDPLFAAVERVAPSMGPVGLANCVWGFGKLNMRWREMPRSAQAALAAQFQAVGPRLGPQAVSSVLAGFAAMDTTWMLLQRSIRYSIETSIIKARVAEMNEQTVSMTLWGLAALKADRAVLQPQVFRPLFDGFVGTGAALKSQGLCSALYGLSVLGWEWGDLPQEVRVTFESYCANSRRWGNTHVFISTPCFDPRPLSSLHCIVASVNQTLFVTVTVTVTVTIIILIVIVIVYVHT